MFRYLKEGKPILCFFPFYTRLIFLHEFQFVILYVYQFLKLITLGYYLIRYDSATSVNLKSASLCNIANRHVSNGNPWANFSM